MPTKKKVKKKKGSFNAAAYKKHGHKAYRKAVIGASSIGASSKKHGGTSKIPKGEWQKLVDRVEAGIYFEGVKQKIKRNYGNTHRRDKKR